jgi:spermidine synthase
MPLRRGKGADNNYLELTLYKNQLQLGTKDVLYSDGDRYIPAVAAVKHMDDFLPHIRTVLVLGAGLCSIVQVMRRKKANPHFTLVEKDKVVLEWAMEFLEPNDGFYAGRYSEV